MNVRSNIMKVTAIVVFAALQVARSQIAVSLPTVTGGSGSSLNIPVTIGSAAGLGVTAFQFVLTYDTSVASITGIDGTNTLSSDFLTVPNLNYAGQLRVASAGITPLVGPGTLLIIKMQLRNPGSTALTFTDFRFNEGSPTAAPVNGKLTVQKVNHPPVFLSGPGLIVVVLNQPVTFRVRAYDPDGDTLTFTWKQDGVIVKTGKDTSYTTIFGGKYGDPHTVSCTASDPGGLHADTAWTFTLTPVEEMIGGVPGKFALSQNYPNPFNPSTTVRFDLPEPAVVSLSVYDIGGVRVRSLLQGRALNAGTHVLAWDGTNQNGVPLPSGIYLLRLQAGDHLLARKMTLLK
ncbi:MAG TPA: FlgD immunoglobulin-like domain containing protein [Bacteroidota bacterium]|nr:FlgD immunoglobulin-like domain containing protein [Bacteroidota bacterium]